MVRMIWTAAVLFLVFALPAASAFSPFDRAFGSGSRDEMLASKCLLTNSQWRVSLDIGLQEGTWMPKRFPGWAESGARLGLDVDIQFTDIPSGTSESLVGPKGSTFQVKVLFEMSNFVSECGQEMVEFAQGGYCISRPTGDLRNAQGSLVRPEGLLRFWLDCPTGAKRRDVEVFPGTRIFFTTGVWDDPKLVKQYDGEYRNVLKEMEEMIDQTRERKNQEGSIVDDLLNFQKMAVDSQQFEKLKERKERLERELPPTGSAVASNGVQIAPSGSLVVKGNGIPDWLPGSEYLILGTFSTKGIGSDPMDFERLGSIYF